MSEQDFPPLSARKVAEYFLANVDQDAGDNISNLKLQKLLYYAQGFHIAMQAGKPMFWEPVVRWRHGPVVASVYQDYKVNGWQGIPAPDRFDPDLYLPEIREILDVVLSVYGQFTAKRLELMTHNELPWLETSENQQISIALLGKFFGEMVEAGRRGEAISGEPFWPTNAFRFQNRPQLAERMRRQREWIGVKAKSKPSGAEGWAADEDWGSPPEPR